MSYLHYFFGATAFSLVTIAALNYLVDPAGIYRNTGINPKTYAIQLISSRIGLYMPDNLELRALASELTLLSKNAECVVLGSSRVMQLSSSRKSKSLQEVCDSILNLGVNAAGLEDHITLSYLVVKNGRPRKIILGIDPWTFAFGKDQGWSFYEEDYWRALSQITDNTQQPSFTSSNKGELFINLFNLEYTIRSVKTLARIVTRVAPKILEVENLDPAIGGRDGARLNDGSQVYSAKDIAADSDWWKHL